jgi:pimeloyl-ACP methyl ester carboxylesterase
MIRRAFLAGLAASFASRRAIAQPQKPEIGSLLNRGLVKTTLGPQAYFEVHGNPAGPNIYLAPPVFSRVANPANVKLQTEIKEGYIKHLGGHYRLLMSDYSHLQGKETGPEETHLTVENTCKDYLAIADAAQMERFAAAGYSWGGNLVLQLATRSPRVIALVVGGWPALDGPYQQMLEFTEQLHKQSPERAEGVHYINYYRSLQGWPEKTELGKLKCPRLNYIDTADSDETNFIATLRKNADALHKMGWETAEVTSGAGHAGGLMPDVACPLIGSFLARHMKNTSA